MPHSAAMGVPVTLAQWGHSLSEKCGAAAVTSARPRGKLPDERSCGAVQPTAPQRQVIPAPICMREKLASVTMVFPLVMLPLVETIRLAYGVSQSFEPARKS